MGIREEQSLENSSREDRQQFILDAIAELEEQRADGVMSDHAYFIKKRALVKML